MGATVTDYHIENQPQSNVNIEELLLCHETVITLYRDVIRERFQFTDQDRGRWLLFLFSRNR